MNQQPSSHRVSFNGTRPLALSKRQAVSALGSSKLVARILWASRHAEIDGSSSSDRAATFLLTPIHRNRPRTSSQWGTAAFDAQRMPYAGIAEKHCAHLKMKRVPNFPGPRPFEPCIGLCRSDLCFLRLVGKENPRRIKSRRRKGAARLSVSLVVYLPFP
jgi:hypothetical protein